MSREVDAVINRMHDLLLEVISMNVASHRPPTLDWMVSEDQRLGIQPTPEELVRRKAYDEGWWDCMEALNHAIAERSDVNDMILGRQNKA
jgi:hypothetical protein